MHCTKALLSRVEYKVHIDSCKTLKVYFLLTNRYLLYIINFKVNYFAITYKEYNYA